LLYAKKAVLNPDALAGQAFQAYTNLVDYLCNAKLCVRETNLGIKAYPGINPYSYGIYKILEFNQLYSKMIDLI